MTNSQKNAASPLLVAIAFATVYIVWGSTYFFISIAIKGIPPFVLGAIRFTIAGILMLIVCILKGDKVWNLKDIFHSSVSGLLLLLIGNGTVIWVEKDIPSAVVAIMVSAGPIWTVLFDKRSWKLNFSSSATIIGLIVGFAGILLLFGQELLKALNGGHASACIIGMILLLFSSMAWTAGSLYSKYRANNNVPARVNIAWQMIASGVAFFPLASLHGEWSGLDLAAVPAKAWFALTYLILFGSIAAFSAYVWLLKVKPATQVSTFAYVNPVIAVILGVVFAGENIGFTQIAGLVVILLSVLLINLVKYKQARHDTAPAVSEPVKCDLVTE